jgi:selenocysteine lyase/cysteine desulfurase
MRCLGLGATARASVGVYSEPSDIDALVDALKDGRAVFGLPDGTPGS